MPIEKWQKSKKIKRDETIETRSRARVKIEFRRKQKEKKKMRETYY